MVGFTVNVKTLNTFRKPDMKRYHLRKPHYFCRTAMVVVVEKKITVLLVLAIAKNNGATVSMEIDPSYTNGLMPLLLSKIAIDCQLHAIDLDSPKDFFQETFAILPRHIVISSHNAIKNNLTKLSTCRLFFAYQNTSGKDTKILTEVFSTFANILKKSQHNFFLVYSKERVSEHILNNYTDIMAASSLVLVTQNSPRPQVKSFTSHHETEVQPRYF